MADRRGGRGIMGPLLAVNFVIYLIILGLAGWSLDKYVNGEQHHHLLGGNGATSHMLVYALICGVTGACSVLIGAMHFRAWHGDSLASAAASAIISWAVTALAFGLVCKQIILAGQRGKRLRTLEAIIIIATVSQSLYVSLLHGGIYNSKLGPGYRGYDPDTGLPQSHEAQKPTSPPAI